MSTGFLGAGIWGWGRCGGRGAGFGRNQDVVGEGDRRGGSRRRAGRVVFQVGSCSYGSGRGVAGGIRLRGSRVGIEAAVDVAGLVFGRAEVVNEVAGRRLDCKAVVGHHREGRAVSAAEAVQAGVEGCAAAEAQE